MKKLILISSFLLAASSVYAFTEPGSAPPAGNVAAPLRLPLSSLQIGGVGIGANGGDIFLDTLNTIVPPDPLEINYRGTAPTKICATIGCGTISAYFDTNGNVGVGTLTPGASTRLNVAGRGLFTGGSNDPGDGTPAGVAIGYNGAGGYGYISAIQTGVNVKKLIINELGGNVGIGLTNPSSKLDVAGGDINITGGGCYKINGVCISTGGGTIGGSGTTNVMPRFSNSTTLADSSISSDGVSATSNGNLYASGNILFSQGGSTRNIGVVGSYDPGKLASIWSMGPAYQLGSDGSAGNLYGLSYSYEPGYAGAGSNPGAISGLGHQMQWRANGVTQTAIGSGIWTAGNITATGNVNGVDGYFDTLNTSSAGDPLEINYRLAAPTKICASAGCGTVSAWFGTNGNVGIGTTGPTYKLDVNGDSIGGWWRTRGNTGWYSESYGVGMFALDSTWVRTYPDGGSTGIWASNGNIATNGCLGIGYSGSCGAGAGGASIAGNVGIGTASPSNKLSVSGVADATRFLAPNSPSPSWGDVTGGVFNSNTTYAYTALCVNNNSGVCNAAGGVVLGLSNTSADINFPTSGNSFINNGGNLGIGTVSPIHKLDIGGCGTTACFYADQTGFGTINSGNNAWWDGSTFNVPSGTIRGNTVLGLQALQIGNASAVGGTPTCRTTSSPITIGVCSSLQKYKENVKNLTLGLDTVMKLRPVTFDWKDKNMGGHDLGFIAEEVNAVDPVLSEYMDGKLSGVKYSQMSAVLVKSVQELKTENDKLKAQNDNLEKRLEALEAKVK